PLRCPRPIWIFAGHSSTLAATVENQVAGGGGGGIIHIVGVTPAGFREKRELDGKPGKPPGGGGGGGGALVFSGRLAAEEDVKNGLRVSGFFFANMVELANRLLY